MSRIELPLPLFFVWIALTVVLMVQGMRLAADRQAEFEPVRATEIGGPLARAVPAGTAHVLLTDAPDGPLAVYQELPERRLLRWTERGAQRRPEGPLLIPLEGLAEGEYVVATADGPLGAADQEMDRPERALRIHARFSIGPP